MPSLLKNRSTLRRISILLILSAALDALSTVYVFRSARTWDMEANPVFRGLAPSTFGGAVVLLFAMKAMTVGLSVLWLKLTMSQVPDLYPRLGTQRGFVQFGNFLFCGVEFRGWKSLFHFPSIPRLYRGLSVPVAVTAIFSEFSAAVVNTFQLLYGLRDVVIFWLVVAGVGGFAGLEILRRDFLALSRNQSSQPTEQIAK